MNKIDKFKSHKYLKEIRIVSNAGFLYARKMEKKKKKKNAFKEKKTAKINFLYSLRIYYLFFLVSNFIQSNLPI